MCHSSLTFLLFLLLLPSVVVAQFNFEIGLRVKERLDEYISTPAALLDYVSNYITNDGLSYPFDRDSFLLLGDALLKSNPHEIIYYANEEGEMAGNFYEPRIGNYREPGNGGYTDIDTNIHYMTCVNGTGVEIPCSMEVGDQYIEATGPMKKCDAEAEDGVVAWCKSYEIKTIKEEDTQPRGYIPLLDICLDSRGLPTQTIGSVLEVNGGELGNCYFPDGILVNRTRTGPYAHCQTGEDESNGELTSCNTTFVGAFQTWKYDPRYRPWYIDAKSKQREHYTEPYVFWTPSGENEMLFFSCLCLCHRVLSIAEKPHTRFLMLS